MGQYLTKNLTLPSEDYFLISRLYEAFRRTIPYYLSDESFNALVVYTAGKFSQIHSNRTFNLSLPHRYFV